MSEQTHTERVEIVCNLLIKESERREKAEEALRTIYENCSRQPYDHLMHCIMATVKAVIPNIEIDTQNKID